ncbi:MAG: hypothetical protein EBY57_03865 [Actinobacteria bacterium]|nr:hypothetical protein [Actinomycetota bacterium]
MFEGIYFANPNFLWLLLLLPLAFVGHLFTWKKKQSVLKISSLSGFQGFSSLWSKVYPFLFGLRLTAMGLLVLAIARPQTVDVSTRTKTNKGIDIVMAIDVSSSMLAQDLKPDRLTALKRVAEEFVAEHLLPSCRTPIQTRCHELQVLATRCVGGADLARTLLDGRAQGKTRVLDCAN